jgi:hypothetical protein
VGEAMSNYSVDPFAGDLSTNLKQLMDAQWATRQAVLDLSTYQQSDEPDRQVPPVPQGKFRRLFGLTRRENEDSLDPKAERGEIGRKASERAAPYSLAENDRNPTIKRAAETVSSATTSFAAACDKMAYEYAVTGMLVRQRVELYMVKTMNKNLQQLGESIEAAARRNDFAAMSTAWAEAAEGLDITSRKFLGGIILELQRIGSLIDVGNAFVNLDKTRNAAMQRYGTGKNPQGWKERLPRPLASIFSEATWIGLEKGAEVLLEGVPSIIPGGAAVVGVVRVVFEVRNDRRHRRVAFRRGDVDDMLDLADQLSEAASAVQRHLDIVAEVSAQVTARVP